MQIDLIAYRDGAKRFYILFVDQIAAKQLWTGDDKGWVNVDETHMCKGYKFLEHCDDPGVIYTQTCVDRRFLGEMLSIIRPGEHRGFNSQTNTIGHTRS